MEFLISRKDWKTTIDYAQASYNKFKAEIGGFMIAKKNKNGDIIISNPEILLQEVTGGTTVMDKAAVADYYVKSAQKHGNDVRFIWWHSHANMKAFWSGTDTNTMEEYSGGDWSAFLVVNIRGEYKFRVCVWNPIAAYEDIEISIIDAKPKSIPKTIQDSVDKLCSEPKTVLNDQLSLNGYNKTYNTELYSHYFGDSNYSQVTKSNKSVVTDDPMFDYTVEQIINLNDLYVEGTFTYKEWLRSIKQVNMTLKSKGLNFNIDELTENELQQKSSIYTGYSPEDIIHYRNKNEKNIKV